MLMTVICYLFDRQIVSAFLSEPEALSYGIEFSRILLTTSFLFGMFYVLSNALQAMGGSQSSIDYQHEPPGTDLHPCDLCSAERHRNERITVGTAGSRCSVSPIGYRSVSYYTEKENV